MIASHFLTWGLSEDERRKAAAIDQSIFRIIDSTTPLERPTWRRLTEGENRIIEFIANERTLITLSSTEFLELPTVEIAIQVRAAIYDQHRQPRSFHAAGSMQTNRKR